LPSLLLCSDCDTEQLARHRARGGGRLLFPERLPTSPSDTSWRGAHEPNTVPDDLPEP
jgi:hypothetical protein